MKVTSSRYTPPSHGVLSGPGTPHFHFMRSTEPSSLVTGLAKKPGGCDFLHSLRSLVSRCLANELIGYVSCALQTQTSSTRCGQRHSFYLSLIYCMTLVYTPFGVGTLQQPSPTNSAFSSVKLPWGTVSLPSDQIQLSIPQPITVSLPNAPLVHTVLNIDPNTPVSRLPSLILSLPLLTLDSALASVSIIHKSALVYTGDSTISYGQLNISTKAPLFCLVEEKQFSNSVILELMQQVQDSLLPQYITKPRNFCGKPNPSDSYVLHVFRGLMRLFTKEMLDPVVQNISAILEVVNNLSNVQAVLVMMGVMVFKIIKLECFLDGDSRKQVCCRIGKMITKNLLNAPNGQVLAMFYCFFMVESELIVYSNLESEGPFQFVRSEVLETCLIGMLEGNLSELQNSLVYLSDLAQTLPEETLVAVDNDRDAVEGNPVERVSMEDMKPPSGSNQFELLKEYFFEFVHCFNHFLFSEDFLESSYILQILDTLRSQQQQQSKPPRAASPIARNSIKAKASFTFEEVRDREEMADYDTDESQVVDEDDSNPPSPAFDFRSQPQIRSLIVEAEDEED